MLKYNKQKLLLILAATGSLSLSGCSWFSANDGSEDIDDSYLKSRQATQLQIPADVSEIKQEDNYQIPEGAVIVNRDPKGKLLGLEPPQLLLTSGDGVREDTEAKHPTVWLRGQSGRLVEYFDGFVAAHNIQVENKDSKSLNTSWLSDDDEGLGEGLGSYNIDNQRHKFQLAMIADSGNEFGIQATHTASEQEIEGQWVEVQTSDRVAKQFLNQFIGYYDGVRDGEARARILAEGVIDTRLGTNSQGHIAMVSERDMQSIWQQTPAVLNFLNLPIVDRDQSQNTFYFKVEEASGFFASIFSDNKEAKVKLEPGNYRLQLEALSQGGTSISFTDEDGIRLSPTLVGQIYPNFKAAYRSREAQQ